MSQLYRATMDYAMNECKTNQCTKEAIIVAAFLVKNDKNIVCREDDVKFVNKIINLNSIIDNDMLVSASSSILLRHIQAEKLNKSPEERD